MKPYRLTKAADADLTAIFDYIAADSEAAAIEMIHSIRDVLGNLAEYPQIGRPRGEFGRGLRSVIVGQYVIYYRVVAKQVVVARVLHGAQHADRQFRRR
jgi:toxin ParE1/3/4